MFTGRTGERDIQPDFRAVGLNFWLKGAGCLLRWNGGTFYFPKGCFRDKTGREMGSTPAVGLPHVEGWKADEKPKATWRTQFSHTSRC